MSASSVSNSGSSAFSVDLRHKESESIQEYAEQLHAQGRLKSTSEGHLYFIEEERSSAIFVPNGDFNKAKSIRAFQTSDPARKKGFTGGDLQRELRVFMVAYNTLIENSENGELSAYTIIDANNRLIISATGKIKPTLSRIIFTDETADGKISGLRPRIHKWQAADDDGDETIYDTNFHTYFGHMSTPGKRGTLGDTTWKKIDEIYEKGEVDHKLKGDKVKPTATSGTSPVEGSESEDWEFNEEPRVGGRPGSTMPMEEERDSSSGVRIEEVHSGDEESDTLERKRHHSGSDVDE